MATTFPALMRKTHFATYDPLIHRIYTSPSASAAKGDWGLKYSLPPMKRDRSQYRNIRVQSLDAGQGLGCDYKPSEKEARFMERWGNGRHGWAGNDQVRATETVEFLNALDSQSSSSADDKTILFKKVSDQDASSVDPSALVQSKRIQAQASPEQVNPIVDLEFMSEERFEALLEEVRSRRGDLLAWKQDQFAKAQEAAMRAEKAKTEEDEERGHALAEQEEIPQSLWDEWAAGRVPSGEAGQFMSDQLLRQMRSARSGSPMNPTKSIPLMPFPHPTHGLAYGNFRPDVDSSHPLTSIPGRSLGRTVHERFKKNEDARGNAKGAREQEQVIGIGGLIAVAKQSQTVPLSPTEYVEAVEKDPRNATVDQGTFRVSSAVVTAPPKVVTAAARSGKKALLPIAQNSRYRKFEAASGAKPLDGFEFQVTVENRGQDERKWARSNGAGAVPGERSWVASDGLEHHESASDTLLAGAFKSPRKPEARTAVENSYMQKGREGKTMDLLSSIVDSLKPKQQQSPSASGSRKGSPSSFAIHQPRSSIAQDRRLFSTSIFRSLSVDDKPTASISPEQMKGGADIAGPGIGGVKEGDDASEEQGSGDDLAMGEWRQIEENVAGDVKYGGKQPEGTGKK